MNDAITTWQLLQEEDHLARLRLAELDAVSSTLTTELELEAMTLERRLARLQPRLAAAKQAAAQQRVVLDVQALQATWATLTAEKQAAYAAFATAVGALAEAWRTVLAVHQAQATTVAGLPLALQQKLRFPDEGSFRSNVASRMVPPLAWGQVLNGHPPALQVPAAVQEIDPGLRPLSPLILAQYQAGAQPWTKTV
jgi:hypothetical protein